jgi:hypothetical protein
VFWFTLARRVTHTSVAMTKQIIGASEYWDWRAYFEIVAEAMKDAEKRNSQR